MERILFPLNIEVSVVQEIRHQSFLWESTGWQSLVQQMRKPCWIKEHWLEYSAQNQKVPGSISRRIKEDWAVLEVSSHSSLCWLCNEWVLGISWGFVFCLLGVWGIMWDQSLCRFKLFQWKHCQTIESPTRDQTMVYILPLEAYKVENENVGMLFYSLPVTGMK